MKPSGPVRLPGAEDDPPRVELRGIRLVSGAAEHVHHGTGPHARKPGQLHDFQVLLDEECSRDSAGPEVDIQFALGRNLLLDHDIRDLESAARLEHPIQLFVDGQLIGAD